MNNDPGIASAQSEGTALPPPRVIGDMTTLTLSAGVFGGEEAASFVATEVGPVACSGQRTALRAAILPAELGGLTITF